MRGKTKFLRVNFEKMMKILIIFSICLIGWNQAAKNVDSSQTLTIKPFGIERVKFINSLNTTWTAGINKFHGHSHEMVKGLLGTYLEIYDDEENEWNNLTKVRKIFGSHSNGISFPTLTTLPENFDSRKQWPQCEDVISHIRDQGSCGSCWAVSTASAITDRVCIASNGKNKTQLSAQKITSCCTECYTDQGCHGGWPIEAWLYWVRQGLVTGGDYADTKTCQPYLIPPCEHHVDGKRPKCGNILPTPQCSDKCTNQGVSEEKNYGKMAFRSGASVGEIKTELFKRGPVTGSFVVYDDFYLYKKGVYQVTPNARALGGHAIVIIGWGKTDEGVEYWLAKNNWNNDWGEQGYFKIKTGEANINRGVCSGIARKQPRVF